MLRDKPCRNNLFRLTALSLLLALTGCYGGYVDYGPEWDGTVYLNGGYGGGYYRNHRDNAFRGGGGWRPVGSASDRGRASMGGRGGGSGGHVGGGGGGHR